MRLDLTEDQQFFYETLRRFVETETPIDVVRAQFSAGFDRSWWKRAAELGATSFLIAEEHGGGSVSGRPAADLVIIAEEFGRAVVPHPLLPVNVIAETISASGSAAQQELLGGVLSGDLILAWAFDEPGANWQLDAMTMRATPSGDGFVLDGTKVAVEAADQADHLLVTVAGNAGPSQFLIPADHPGVTIQKQGTLDLLRTFGKIRFENVQVGADALVGVESGAAADIERQELTAMLLQCAEMAGAMARVLEFTTEYAFDRYSFGRPLASYQALKHRFADMKLWTESSHAIVDDAAVALSSGRDASSLVRAAKVYVGDKSVDVIQDCVQLHGGIGVTWEHDIHLFLRRVTVLRGLFGSPSDHRAALSVAVGV